MRLSGKKGRLRVQHREEDFSPMEGVGNMADAMLVFACGLIVALMLSWNVDVTDQGIQKNPETKYEVEGIDDKASETVDSTQNLQEMGKVYMDPQTGKYYVVENTQPAAGTSDAATEQGGTTAASEQQAASNSGEQAPPFTVAPGQSSVHQTTE